MTSSKRKLVKSPNIHSMFLLLRQAFNKIVRVFFLLFWLWVEKTLIGSICSICAVRVLLSLYAEHPNQSINNENNSLSIQLIENLILAVRHNRRCCNKNRLNRRSYHKSKRKKYSLLERQRFWHRIIGFGNLALWHSAWL